MLMDAVEIYKREMEASKSMHSDDINISNIEKQVTTEIQKWIQSSQNTNTQTEKDDEVSPEHKNEENCDAEK